MITEAREDGQTVSEATVKLTAGGQPGRSRPRRATARSTRSTARCARRSSTAYPQLAKMELTDYKVRIMPGRHGTDAVTRVLIETTDREREWTTVGVHGNVIEASWLALHDAVRYGLLQRRRSRRSARQALGARAVRRRAHGRQHAGVARVGAVVPVAVGSAGAAGSGSASVMCSSSGSCSWPQPHS